MLALKIAIKLLKSGGRYVSGTSIFSVAGLILGVASLITAMAIVSGFEKTIKNSIIDLTGHIIIMKRGSYISEYSKLKDKILKIDNEIAAVAAFHSFEAVIAHNGKVNGVRVEGFQPNAAKSVLNIHERIIKGKYSFKKGNEEGIILAKGVAEMFNYKIGDTVNLILPKPSQIQSHRFKPKLKELVLTGVVDLGKYEYNQRFVIVSAKTARILQSLKADSYRGISIRIKDDYNAEAIANKIVKELGAPYYSKNWYQLNYNFFESLKLEKRIIFFVVSVMVLIACLNVASSLYLSVMRRFNDISILKALGANSFLILKIFTIQGMFIGLIGALGGIPLGYLFCWIIKTYGVVDIPPDIYKIDHLPIEVQTSEVALIVVLSFLLCSLASIIPALRGAKLNAVEGLRYE